MARTNQDDGYEVDGDTRSERSRTGLSDVLGVVGLLLGILAAMCLALGCVTCGLTFFAVAPLSAIGLWCSIYGRGGLRIAGLILNIVILVPGIPIFGFMVFGIGMDVVVPQRQGD